jgi:hypothetical protein
MWHYMPQVVERGVFPMSLTPQVKQMHHLDASITGTRVSQAQIVYVP